MIFSVVFYWSIYNSVFKEDNRYILIRSRLFGLNLSDYIVFDDISTLRMISYLLKLAKQNIFSSRLNWMNASCFTKGNHYSFYSVSLISSNNISKEIMFISFKTIYIYSDENICTQEKRTSKNTSILFSKSLISVYR